MYPLISLQLVAAPGPESLGGDDGFEFYVYVDLSQPLLTNIEPIIKFQFSFPILTNESVHVRKNPSSTYIVVIPVRNTVHKQSPV